MNIKISKKSDFVVISPKGKIDAVSYTDLQQKMEEIINKGNNNLLLNLSEVDYISSAGLRAILTIAKKLYGNGSFAIISPKPSVLNILKIVGLVNIINIYDSFEKVKK